MVALVPAAPSALKAAGSFLIRSRAADIGITLELKSGALMLPPHAGHSNENVSGNVDYAEELCKPLLRLGFHAALVGLPGDQHDIDAGLVDAVGRAQGFDLGSMMFMMENKEILTFLEEGLDLLEPSEGAALGQ